MNRQTDGQYRSIQPPLRRLKTREWKTLHGQKRNRGNRGTAKGGTRLHGLKPRDWHGQRGTDVYGTPKILEEQA